MDGPPSREWLPESLIAFIQIEKQQIIECDHAQARHYWRLGRALEALRHHFNHGQWQAFLKQTNLDKTRVSRARAISRSFAEETELSTLTVREAYARRPRKQASATTKSSPDRRPDWPAVLLKVEKLIEPCIDEAAFAEQQDVAIWLAAVERVLGKLEHIQLLLLDKATEPSRERDERPE